MKIRTLDDLQNMIDTEMGWRKRELSALKANINSSRLFAKDTALRSGIAILYAHWEGAIKSIAYYYLVYVSSLKISYSQLKPNFLAITLKNEMNIFNSTNKNSLHTEIVGKIYCLNDQNSNIPTEGIITTGSNLNSTIFKEIMSTIGLNTELYEQSYNLIDEVLLNMRNHIAHGERLESISLDEIRYNEIHEKIFNLIDCFAIQVSNAAFLKEYLK